jgi:hypothetical protein
MKKRIVLSAKGIVALLISGVIQTASAQIYHANDKNPVTDEGFSENGTLSGFPTNDAGTLAWVIQDTDTGNRAQYNVGSTPDPDYYRTNGWSLTWKLKIVDGPDTILDSTARGIEMNWRYKNDGVNDRRYNIRFGLTNGNATVFMLTGPAITVPGAGVGFHKWTLERRPGTDVAGFYVDGTFLTNYSGFADSSEARLYWGSITAPSTGTSEWSLILLEVPEPSALGLLSLGASGVFLLQRRRA